MKSKLTNLVHSAADYQAGVWSGHERPPRWDLLGAQNKVNNHYVMICGSGLPDAVMPSIKWAANIPFRVSPKRRQAQATQSHLLFDCDANP